MKKLNIFKNDAVIKFPVCRVPISHSRARARAHTHTYTCTRTHARTLAHTRTHARTHARLLFLTTYKQGTRSRMVGFGDEEEFATCFGRTSSVR